MYIYSVKYKGKIYCHSAYTVTLNIYQKKYTVALNTFACPSSPRRV